jgi:ferredoxin-type protein NapH
MPLETIPPVIGLLYVIIGIPLNAYIWYKGKFSKKIRVAFSLISVALGFLIFSPMAPFQLQSIALNDTQSLGFPVAGAIAFMVLFIVLVLVAGRIFCGYLCPIGAVQELAYEVPAKKARLLQKSTLFAIRSVFFILFFAMAFFLSTGILDFFGIRQFFYLDVASIFFVFDGIRCGNNLWVTRNKPLPDPSSYHFYRRPGHKYFIAAPLAAEPLLKKKFRDLVFLFLAG